MINSKNIIQRGEQAKFQVIIEREDFSMTDNDFTLLLTWGLRGQSLEIPKSEMIQNEGGETFFSFPTNDMIGRVEVECRYDVPDTDYAEGIRTETERQPLCWVVADAKLPTGTDPGLYKGDHVSYIRRQTGGLRSLYRILRDVTSAWLRDSNGLVIRGLRKN